MKIELEIEIPKREINYLIDHVVDSYEDPNMDDVESDLLYQLELKLKKGELSFSLSPDTFEELKTIFDDIMDHQLR
jgi:hypothetical protein